MTTVRGAWTLQNLDSAYQGRLHDGALLAATNLVGLSGTPMSTWRPGVLSSINTASSQPYAIDLLVVANSSPAMNVQVYGGGAVLPRAGQGPYVAYSDAPVTVTVAASDPTNPRVDVVYMQVLDAAVGDAGTLAKIDIVTGIPAGVPTVPSIPTNAIPLAQVAVAALATQIISANITDIRKSAALRGALRQLLPGDQLSDPGYVVGEQRGRYHSGYGVYMIDKWGVDGQWHGTQDLEITQPTLVTPGLPMGAFGTFASVVLPDPGWPYHVESGGSMYAQQTSGGAAGSVILDIYVQVDSATPGTNMVTQGNGANWSSSTSLPQITIAPVRNSRFIQSAGYTGSHTLYFVGQSGGGNISTLLGGNLAGWYIKLVPA